MATPKEWTKCRTGDGKPLPYEQCLQYRALFAGKPIEFRIIHDIEPMPEMADREEYAPPATSLLNANSRSADYRNRGKGRFFSKESKATSKPSRGGVGTQLHELLVSLGIDTPCITCGSFANKMDKWGIEKCKTVHREDIIKHLDEEAAKATWLDWIKVAKGGYFTSTALLDEAIRRAEVERDIAGELQ